MTTAAAPLEIRHDWQALPWREWEPTVETLHRWLQIVGKVRMAFAPPLNHWWHTTLYVGPRGLTTSAIPHDDRSFEVAFDFFDHRLTTTDSTGRSFSMALEPRSVADFYREFTGRLGDLGIEARIWRRPVEIEDATPFDEDEHHAAYDREQVAALWAGLQRADRLLKEFQTGFVGKASPVHLFWGGFDLATSRYSGRAAPRHAGGIPNCADWVMEEAYSREETAAGWWPSSTTPGPAFYAYAYPEPARYRSAVVGPDGARYDPELGEFLLPEDEITKTPDPDGAVLDFLRSTYEAAADLGGWDRRSLEPSAAPGRPQRRPWSTVP